MKVLWSDDSVRVDVVTRTGRKTGDYIRVTVGDVSGFTPDGRLVGGSEALQANMEPAEFEQFVIALLEHLADVGDGNFGSAYAAVECLHKRRDV